MLMNDAAPPSPTRAVRLIFEYDGNQVRLVGQVPVEMTVTSVDVTPSEGPAYYVDTRDAADQTLARVTAHGAFATSAEVFPEQPGQPIVRVDVAQPRGRLPLSHRFPTTPTM
jgi:hypothetical protein